MPSIAKITFHGGTGSVTGANFLIEADGKKILVDCGLNQGMKLVDDINWEPFVYNPAEIDILFITHAHVDHVGRIPKLISEGFRGKIYSTFPTKALAEFMLRDTMGILSKNTKFNLGKIYNEENLKLSFSLWRGFDYQDKIEISPNLEASFYWRLGAQPLSATPRSRKNYRCGLFNYGECLWRQKSRITR